MMSIKYISSKNAELSIVGMLDLISFILLLVGAGLVRYGNNEITSILGGFVMAGAATILSLARYLGK